MDVALVGGDGFVPRDEYLQGAAAFLEKTRVLEMRFGEAYKWANPWREAARQEWAGANDRPGVCESGLVSLTLGYLAADSSLEDSWHPYTQRIGCVKLLMSLSRSSIGSCLLLGLSSISSTSPALL